MRRLALTTSLTTFLVLESCTVVPDPTAGGVVTTPSATSVAASWKTSYIRSTESYTDRLSLFASHRYQRWVIDSTLGSTTVKDVLIERGTWNFVASDSGRIALAPSLREIWSGSQLAVASSPAPDAVSWSFSGDTLHWTTPRWSNRDSTETLHYLAD